MKSSSPVILLYATVILTLFFLSSCGFFSNEPDTLSEELLPVTDAAVSAGYESAVLTWTNPSGTDFLSVTVTWYDGETEFTYESTPDPSGTLIEGLENGKEYTFRLTALYTDGKTYDPVILTAIPVEYSSQVLGKPFDSGKYRGYMEPGEGSLPLSSSQTGITISQPAVTAIEADGYFSVTGTVNAEAPTDYYLLTLSKGEEQTNYWISGSFDEQIWLRFGEGEYEAAFYQVVSVTENTEGVISGWSYSSPAAAVVTVSNNNPEDGRYLYPSQVIQSQHPDILAAAAPFTGQNVEDLLKNLHDFEVKNLYYDLDSLTVRKKQDAVSTLQYGMAVCEGYTTLYAALLRAFSIPTAYVSGGNHAWNWGTDGTDYKYTDVTWDDPLLNGTSDYPGGRNLRYDYFRGDLWSDHTLEETSASRSPEKQSFPTEFPGYPEGFY